MRPIHLLAFICLLLCSCRTTAEPDVTLKEAVGKHFLVGTALNRRQLNDTNPAETELITRNFDAIVAENCMKSEVLAPEPGVYDFSEADRFVAFGEAHGLLMTGHCLIWHDQCPKWFFVDEQGETVSREVLIQRMRTYITDVLNHFRGKLLGWDVVNEAIMEDGSYRNSPFYKIIGPEFIDLAFQFAYEADSTIELYYNDYGMTDPGRRDGVIRLIRRLKEEGCRIDAVGMQSHIGMDFPDLQSYERTIRMFAAEGVHVMATELDMTVLPLPDPQYYGASITKKFAYSEQLNPYAEGLPDSLSTAQNERYLELMNLYLRNADVISRVTFWGVTDDDSWKNDWPIRGRKDYPLAIDRAGAVKPFVRSLWQLQKQH